ncbi:MAG: FAD-dependent oxidoreductase [Peptococcaceae bacterium]|jgi:uncharacterized FAD-dependent dehydrogenase|nr:FAD-dependent oxidoreductase [Peptococcaceae bacterium]MDH7524672.1 FAD-dependent oxidoreductase [Peptococcaceae bacterium]
MLRVTGLKLSLEEDIKRLPYMIARKLRIKSADILDWYVFKQSIDARDRRMIYFVYTVDVVVKNEAYLISKINDPGVSFTPPLRYEFAQTGSEKLKDPPVVIGTGPSGLFAGLLLAQMGYQPLILERGDNVETRAEKVRRFWETGCLDGESNVQFGEGGAGTFSDGKLTTLIKDKERRCRKVLEELVQAGAPASILYSFKPHIGTDVLQRVVKNLRGRIRELGGQVLFRSRVTDLIVNSGRIDGVVVNGRDRINCQAVVLATGHSARDVFRMLYEKGVKLQPKPFSIGVRIEHHQEVIDRAQYREFAGHPRLGAAEYKLAYHSPSGRSAYTFCMCPGGTVVAAASEHGYLVTNGMSEHARDGRNANSALLVGVTPQDFPGDHPLSGVEFQRRWEKAAFLLGGGGYLAPAQLLSDFLEGRVSTVLGSVKPTYPRGVTLADLAECLPSYVTETLREAISEFGRKLQGFAAADAVLTGVETRSSSPVRIARQDDFQACFSGLYPAGEGAGYAGGIVSAAVDGLRVGEALARRFKPLQAGITG